MTEPLQASKSVSQTYPGFVQSIGYLSSGGRHKVVDYVDELQVEIERLRGLIRECHNDDYGTACECSICQPAETGAQFCGCGCVLPAPGCPCARCGAVNQTVPHD